MKLMKNRIIISLVSGALLFTSCADLDLYPLSEGSSENWYSDKTEIELSLNDLYRADFWSKYNSFGYTRYDDDWCQRQVVTDFTGGNWNSQTGDVEDLWLLSYKVINRANAIINSMEKVEGKVPDQKIKQYTADAMFMRAAMYSRLIFLYGDVPYYTETPDIDEAFKMGRTDKKTVLQNIYQDFDYAIENLPVTYAANELLHATKGTALAFKARVALHFSEWAVARDAAKACIDLGVYSLHPDYRDYFLSTTRNSKETIFAIPRDYATQATFNFKNFITRTPGGTISAIPSWDLMATFLCTDGLPIDESPLYNPQTPFLNRDPRLAATIAPFGSEFLGFIYDPNPYTTKVLNVKTGLTVSNKDCRAVDQYASYNGLALKKWVDERVITNGFLGDFDLIVMRYADVLLMYAESKIELNEIDASAIDAFNQVGARAYGVKVTETSKYPAVAALPQARFRKILRMERRSELAWENRRFFDLIRWRIAEKALTRPIYGMLDVAKLKTQVVDKGLWFFPGTPSIDEDGIPDYSEMYKANLIKILAERKFDKTRQYLWPIPSKEILINQNLVQNPNY
jgi:hypothetical protein